VIPSTIACRIKDVVEGVSVYQRRTAHLAPMMAKHRRRNALSSRFKMGLNLFQGLAFGFWQEEGYNQEVDHREAGEQKEH
jgi:hypothetical protein